MTAFSKLEAPPASLVALMAQFERAIRANDYKQLARDQQQALRQGLEVYQAAVAVLPRDHKLPQQVASAVQCAGRTLTQSNARILAMTLDVLLVTIQFQFPERRVP